MSLSPLTNSLPFINAAFLADSYKASHKQMTSKGVTHIYSNLTPRFTGYLEERFTFFDGGIVWFGMQAAVKKIMQEYWEETFFKRDKAVVIGEIKRIFSRYIGMTDVSHFEQLHDLGYMPVLIKALPEGCVISKGVPCFTITNTHPDFQWLPNYLESVLSTEIWKTMTTATIGRAFKNLVTAAALETTGSAEGAAFQLHDFSLRGQSGIESAAAAGGGFLLSTMGTDNIPSIVWMEHYYKANIEKEDIAFSVAAGEHSVTTLGIQINAKRMIEQAEKGGYYVPSLDEVLLPAEIEYARYVMEQFPEGIVSYVADSYDYFKFLDKALPVLKEDILSREGKFVVRGDSGDPVEIIAGINIEDFSDSGGLNLAAMDAFSEGFDFENPDESEVEEGYVKILFKYQGNIYKALYQVDFDKYEKVQGYSLARLSDYELTTQEKGTIEHLFDIFGGNVNEKGYIDLDEHIGMIYGDGITGERAVEIFRRLKNKGFSSTNIVFGVGSYTLNMLSRDDLGTAVKATCARVGDEYIPIYKDPKTDTSKKSAKGLLRVNQADNGTLYLVDDVTPEQEIGGMLQEIYEDGSFPRPTIYSEVLENLEYYNRIWVNQ
jgi:nicotinamide phosphoribosyltransferase